MLRDYRRDLMSSTTTPAPIAASERIEALDVIRGFALFGIFLVNIEWFTPSVEGMGAGIRPAGSVAQRRLVVYPAGGKFWGMFSLLSDGFAVIPSDDCERTRLQRV